MSLLELDNLQVTFQGRRGRMDAVKGVTLSVEPGEVLGIVGESGAGKSTVGYSVIGLIDPPGRVSGGRIILGGDRIDTLSAREMRRLRGGQIGMIFQDPMTSCLRAQNRQLRASLQSSNPRRRAVQTLLE